MPAIDFAAIMAHEKKRAKELVTRGARASGAAGDQSSDPGSALVGGPTAAPIWVGRARPQLDDVSGQGISRIRFCPDFLTAQEQMAVVAAITSQHAKEEWLQLPARRLLNLGGVPHPSGMIAEELPPWLDTHDGVRVLARLSDLGVFDEASMPDQVLLNYYDPGQGIDAHNDGPLYQPLAAIISLGSNAILSFSDLQKSDDRVASVVLTPGSLLVFDRDAYTTLRHGIDGTDSEVVPPGVLNLDECGHKTGDTLTRLPRFSLTIRKVRKVAIAAGEYLNEDDIKEAAARRRWWASAVSEKGRKHTN